MNTPICDFVKEYAQQNKIRLHMPGHKGKGGLGCESFDITEISGADSLYEAQGIIAQSESNASKLFGCDTFYSTEGSSHALRAMLCLCLQNAKQKGLAPLVLAGRNAHKSFVSAAALLDFDLQWIYPRQDESYLSCTVTPEKVEGLLRSSTKLPAAVYVTSPDYLGNIADIKGIAEVCHKYGTLLLVDNAHGAYLKYLTPSRHPADLGADMCCASAHKTLPVLTGGAYLHICGHPEMTRCAKNALALFGSTSPSYLILQSLDMANKVMSEGYKEQLDRCVSKVKEVKSALEDCGYTLAGDELMKITLAAKKYGYKGYELATVIANKGIEWEFADEDYLVFMPSANSSPKELDALLKALMSIPQRSPISACEPLFSKPKQVMSIRAATLSLSECLPLSRCEGRVLSRPTVSCPPAVPILVSGELIDKAAIERFEYYGVNELTVVK